MLWFDKHQYTRAVGHFLSVASVAFVLYIQDQKFRMAEGFAHQTRQIFVAILCVLQKINRCMAGKDLAGQFLRL